jgi:hypothetical protein
VVRPAAFLSFFAKGTSSVAGPFLQPGELIFPWAQSDTGRHGVRSTGAGAEDGMTEMLTNTAGKVPGGAGKLGKYSQFVNWGVS